MRTKSCDVSRRAPYLRGFGAHLIVFLFLFSFVSVANCQQPAASPSSSPAAQQAYALKIDFNRRVHMRDGVELSACVI